MGVSFRFCAPSQGAIAFFFRSPVAALRLPLATFGRASGAHFRHSARSFLTVSTLKSQYFLQRVRKNELVRYVTIGKAPLSRRGH